MGNNTWELFTRSNSYHTSSDASLFSSSLPVLSHEKLNINELNHELVKKFLEDDEDHAVESLLPNEDEFLAGMVDDLVEDSEEYDFFGSGGGLELENDPLENLRVGVSSLNLSDGGVDNGGSHLNYTNGVGPVAGEHPFGEHPSRTLFVRNINSNVEDAEIRTLFEQYGDIRTLYTLCKHRGFVMISYYDIRAARTAMRALQNKPLRKRKLDIHFSIPKENPSDKDINQGTLVVFNLDPSVSIDDLRQIFGAYGEVREIRETPHKRHHKFIEFYDIRAAEAALKSLNRSDIAGKRIKLEPSRPGGARRSSLLHPNNDLEQEERNFHHMVSLGNSPPGNWPQLMERNPVKNCSNSPVFGSTNPPVGSRSVPGLASVLNQKAGPTSKYSPSGHYLEHIFANGISDSRGIFEQSHSSPDQNSSSKFSGPWPASSFGSSSFSGSTTKPSPGLFGGNNDFNHLNHHYHVGSAPSGVPLERKFGYYQVSPKASFVGPICNDRCFSRNSGENGSPVFGMPSGRLSPGFLGNGHFHGLGGSSLEGLAERRSRHFEIKGAQLDTKKQFQIDLDRITSGEDSRTTLMIKNIPNKYTSKMLMAAIDDHHKGTYDFLYLPIDFKNKCNMGYAFINMLSPLNIIPFYEEFNGKKWEKFNSEKVASLAFARIQGKAALVAHFQNSSLMNEDKHCRPILFDSERTGFTDKIIQENRCAFSLSSQARQSNGSDDMFPLGPTLQNISGDQLDER